MADNRVVVGVFADQKQAEQALHDLHSAGFRDEHIGFIVRDATSHGETTEKLETATEPTSTADVITGGVLGGIVGAVISLLIPGLGPAIAGGILTTVGGVALGAATGSFIAFLTHMGVPEEEAENYHQAFQAGRTIVIVQADERPMEAFNILKHNDDYGTSTDAEIVKANDPEATVKLEPLESK